MLYGTTYAFQIVLLITMILKKTPHSLKMILRKITKSEVEAADFVLRKFFSASLGKYWRHMVVINLGKYDLAMYKFI